MAEIVELPTTMQPLPGQTPAAESEQMPPQVRPANDWFSQFAHATPEAKS